MDPDSAWADSRNAGRRPLRIRRLERVVQAHRLAAFVVVTLLSLGLWVVIWWAAKSLISL